MKPEFRLKEIFKSTERGLPECTIDFGSNQCATMEEVERAVKMVNFCGEDLITEGFDFQEDGTFVNPQATKNQIEAAQRIVANAETLYLGKPVATLDEVKGDDVRTKGLRDYRGRPLSDCRPELFMSKELRKQIEARKHSQVQSGEAQLDNEIGNVEGEFKKLTDEVKRLRTENSQLKKELQQARQSQLDPKKSYAVKIHEGNGADTKGKKYLNFLVVEADSALMKEMDKLGWTYMEGKRYFYQEVKEGEIKSKQSEIEAVFESHGMHKVEAEELSRIKENARGRGSERGGIGQD